MYADDIFENVSDADHRDCLRELITDTDMELKNP